MQHFLHTGTIWVHGPSVAVPTTEMQPRKPFGEYGIQKAAIEAYLIDEARRNGFPATIVHPGHIVGPGWNPLNPAGHFNPQVFSTLAQGEELALPNFGLETVHHVHADDVAQVFMKAIANWSASVGEAFHAVSPAAVTLRGYAEATAAWFGKEPKLTFLPWPEWKAAQASEEEATADLGAHRAEPEFEHREGRAAARLRAALHIVRGGLRGRGVADHEGNSDGPAEGSGSGWKRCASQSLSYIRGMKAFMRGSGAICSP